MQVEGLVQYITDVAGKLIQLLGFAVGDWGNYVYGLSQNTTTVEQLTNGIFAETDGLLYWVNDKIVYLLNSLLNAEFGSNLGNFLQNLLGVSFTAVP